MTKAIVRFHRWHLALLLETGAAAGGQMRYDIDTLVALEKENSWTAMVDEVPIACGGTLTQWPGRSVAWTYLPLHTGSHMRWLTREVKAKLDRLEGRIEFTVRVDFKAGHRWARMLGFDVETALLKAYGPEGEDHVGYVRLNR